MKYAILYFSNSGNTRQIAEAIREKFPADVFIVKPAQEYGSFAQAVARVVRETMQKKEPAYEGQAADLSGYDVVFLGFPVWAGTMPQFMQAYVKDCGLSRQKVIPFVTAAGTGKASALQTVHTLLPDADISDYFFTSKREKADRDAWLDSLAKKF